eukprot:m.48272 g.48272  ORF g.48272 m.48272 type:complete len:90 (+) comp11024_c0_seq1:129-398(+)
MASLFVCPLSCLCCDAIFEVLLWLLAIVLNVRVFAFQLLLVCTCTSAHHRQKAASQIHQCTTQYAYKHVEYGMKGMLNHRKIKASHGSI